MSCELPPTPDQLLDVLDDCLGQSSAHFSVAARSHQRPPGTQRAIDALTTAKRDIQSYEFDATVLLEAPHHQYCRLQLQSYMLHAWQLQVRYWKRRRELQQLLKHDRRHYEAELADSLRQAWRHRDHHAVWAIARQMSGSKLGPKKRLFDRAAPESPTAAEWYAAQRLPGHEGGQMASYHTPPPQPQPRSFSDDLRAVAHARARQDFEGLQHRARRAKLRKTTPPGTIPFELYRMALHPNDAPSPQAAGLGSNDPDVHLPNFQALLHNLLWSIRLYGATPTRWHHSRAYPLPKHNDKPGCKGLRLIHVLDGLGTSYYLRSSLVPCWAVRYPPICIRLHSASM